MTDRDRAQGSLASRVNELAALYEFTEQLFRTKSSADIYSAGMDAVRTALGCTRVAILLFDDHGVMRFVAWRGLSEEYRDAVDRTFAVERRGSRAKPGLHRRR